MSWAAALRSSPIDPAPSPVAAVSSLGPPKAAAPPGFPKFVVVDTNALIKVESDPLSPAGTSSSLRCPPAFLSSVDSPPPVVAPRAESEAYECSGLALYLRGGYSSLGGRSFSPPAAVRPETPPPGGEALQLAALQSGAALSLTSSRARIYSPKYSPTDALFLLAFPPRPSSPPLPDGEDSHGVGKGNFSTARPSPALPLAACQGPFLLPPPLPINTAVNIALPTRCSSSAPTFPPSCRTEKAP